MRLKRRKSLLTPVDLTPMIDVVFQLILFFLVSTTFAVLPAISVKLPDSETAVSEEVSSITVTVTAGEKIYFNDREVSLKTLDKALSKYDTAGKTKEEIPVNIEADEKVPNGVIVKIFDVLRKNGFIAVNLRTAV